MPTLREIGDNTKHALLDVHTFLTQVEEILEGCKPKDSCPPCGVTCVEPVQPIEETASNNMFLAAGVRDRVLRLRDRLS